MAKDEKPQTPDFAGRGAQPFERLARAVMEKSLAKRGFASADLITNWAVIVGPEMAAVTEPERLKTNRGKDLRGATLVVRVDRSALLDAPMWQPLLIERINGYLGLGTIEKLVLVPASVAPPRRHTTQDQPAAAPARTLDEALEKLKSHVKS